MKIGNFDLDQRVLVIAEIGNNHEGNATQALELVSAAAETGADAVKVQVINPERLVNRSQVERIAQLSRFRLPLSVFGEMAALAKSKGMLFIASAFDQESLQSIVSLVDAVKIASGDLDFAPLLRRAAQLGKPLILSTGMSSLREIKSAIETIALHLPHGQSPPETLALLHCVSLYPVPPREANLKAILTLRQTFGLTVGYSDHTLGIEIALLALGLGARIIEKHFTLDKTRASFRDHALSADASDMRRLADIAHNLIGILGTGEKEPSTAEREAATLSRRSIVAACELPVGKRLTLDDFDYVRPQKGLSPVAVDGLLGKTLRTALKAHDLVLEDHVA